MMRPLQLLLTALPAAFLGQGVLADTSPDSPIQEICGAIQNVWNCKAEITIPDGVKVKMCTEKQAYPELNPCKTRQALRRPCPTLRKPLRTCDAGSVCVPGTDEKFLTVEYPCDIILLKKKVDLCQSVRGALGNVGQETITKLGAVCQCLPPALDMLKSSLYRSVVESADITAAATDMIASYIRLQKCILDNGFKVQDNKAEILAGPLSTDGGWVVLQAKEIDLASYAELTAAVAPCFVGACNPLHFFTNYYEESRDLLQRKAVQVLKGWIDVFDKIKAKIGLVIAAAESLIDHLASVPGKIEDIKKKVCATDACLGPAATAFTNKVSKAIAVLQDYKTVKKACETIAADVPKMMALVNVVAEAAESPPSLEYLLEVISRGPLSRVTNIIDALKVTKDIPRLATDIQKAGGPLVSTLSKYARDGDAGLALIEDILNTAWESYPLEFAADSSGNVRAGLVAVQGLVRDELRQPLANVTARLRDIENVLDLVPIREGSFAVKASVASYQRWSEVSMDMPCTKMQTDTFELLGFKTSFSYPVFFKCRYGPKRVPWPNQHIPYIKFRIK